MSFIIQALFFIINIQSNMSEQEKKRPGIYDLLIAETKPKRISEIIGVSLWLPSKPKLYPLDYVIWGVLENKTNRTSHPNIGSLKTATEEEWNKMSEEFIFEFYFTINIKMVAILSKLTVLCLFSYFIYFLIFI